MKDQKIHLPYLLGILSSVSFVGRLELRESGTLRVIYLRRGKLVNVVSQHQEETLGRLLLGEGTITAEQYRKALDRMLEREQPCGDVLIEMGVLTPQQVFSGLERQVKKKLLRAFKMLDFGFEIRAEDVPVQHLIAAIDVPQILYAAIQEGYSLDRLLSEFPVHEDTLFEPRKQPREHAPRISPLETRLHRAIGQGGTKLIALIGRKEDYKQQLSALYALHALQLIDASNLSRFSAADLEIPGWEEELIFEEPIIEQPEPEPEPVAAIRGEEREPPPFEEPPPGPDPEAMLAQKVLSLPQADHFAVLEINRETKGQELKNAYFRILRLYRLQTIAKSYPSSGARSMAWTLLDRVTMAYCELLTEPRRMEYLQTLTAKKAEPRVSTSLMADVEAQKGELALHDRRYEDAAQHFHKAISLNPDDATYFFSLGLALYHQLGEGPGLDEEALRGARRQFQKAIKLDAQYDQPWLYLGYLDKRAGDLKEALHKFKTAAKLNPQNTLAASEIRHLSRRLRPSK